MTIANWVGKIAVGPDGSMAVERRKLNIGSSAYAAGGNESQYMLVLGSAGVYSLLDVVNNSNTLASIPTIAGETSVAVAPFTAGDGFLVLHYTATACKVQRYVMDISAYPRQAVEVGPLMTLPAGYVVDRQHVFDEGSYTGVFALESATAPDGDAVHLLVLDNAHDTPIWDITLYDGVGNTVWLHDTYQFACGFTRIDGTYQVLWSQPALHQLDATTKPWNSLLRAPLDIATGTLGTPVLVSDYYDSDVDDLVRADSGVTALVVDTPRTPALSGEEHPRKISVVTAVPDDTTTGDVGGLPWVGRDDTAGATYGMHLFVGTSVAATDSNPSGSGDTGLPSNTVSPPRFGDLSFELKASLALRVAAPVSYVATDLVPSVRANVEPYFVVGGRARRHTSWGISAVATVGMGAMTTAPGWPSPASVDLGSDFRWLPLAGSMSGYTWVDQIAGEGLYLDAAPPPTLDLAGSYLRGDTLVDAPVLVYNSFDEGGGNSSNPLLDAAGNPVGEATMFLVATLRPPEFDYYVLLATSDIDAIPKPDLPLLELRYYADGRVVLYARSQLTSFQTATGVVRAGQPIILGMSLDTVSGIVTVVACDRNPAFAQVRLPGNHPDTIEVYLADTPETYITPVGAQPYVASMDVLDFAVWKRALNTDELAATVHTLDSIYGVTQE